MISGLTNSISAGAPSQTPLGRWGRWKSRTWHCRTWQWRTSTFLSHALLARHRSDA